MGLNISRSKSKNTQITDLGVGLYLNCQNYTELPVYEYLSHLTTPKEEIEGFYIDINKLKKLPEELELHFPNLKELSAGGNLLSEIRTLPLTLTILQLGCNQLAKADLSSLSTLTNLEDLSLSANELSNLPNLSSLSSLTRLNVSENKIKSIEIITENIATSLKRLEISSNQLGASARLDLLANRFPLLEFLNISENSIENIDDLITLRELSVLQVNSNLISKFPVNFETQWAHLTRLYFDYNSFPHFPHQIFKLSKLFDLQFSCNPFILSHFDDLSPPSHRLLHFSGDKHLNGDNNNNSERDSFYQSIDDVKQLIENTYNNFIDHTNNNNNKIVKRIDKYTPPDEFEEARRGLDRLEKIIEINFQHFINKYIKKIKKHVSIHNSFCNMILPMGLYLGDHMSARNLPILKILKITHIVSVCEFPIPFPNQFHYHQIRIRDVDSENIFDHFEIAYEFISSALSAGGNVLVHCRAGVSRSASIVISFLMKQFHLRVSDAFDHVLACRPCIGPNNGFMFQLSHWEALLFPPGDNENNNTINDVNNDDDKDHNGGDVGGN